MKLLRKNWLIITFSILCTFTVAGVYFYQDTYELIHIGLIPYLIIVPGFLYFSYQIKGRLGKLISLCFIIILFMLPLLASWLDVRSMGSILGGFLPNNDASSYYNDALGLLDGNLFDGLSVRRPIFTAFLSFIFAITGRNLMLALVILVLINAILCYFFIQKVNDLWGSLAGIIVTILLFLYYRRFAGTTLTENLGLALGMAGSAILLLGAQKSNKIIILFGILLLSMGMNVRAGALLVLPLIVLWGGWIFRSQSRLSVSFLLLGFIAVSLGFLINFGVDKLVVDREISASKTGMFSNYSYTFYGLVAGGKGWKYVNDVHPELMGLINRESLIYEYAFDSIYQNPLLFLKGMTNSFVDFFSPRFGAFSFLYASTSDPCTMENFAESLASCKTSIGSPKNLTKISCITSTVSLRIVDILSSLVVALFLLIPLGWGIWICYKKREKPWCSLLLAIIIGILLSVPLVPPRDASKMRAYAVTQPLMITIAAVGLLDITKSLADKYKGQSFLKKADAEITELKPDSSHGLIIFCLLLTIMIIISPIVSKLRANNFEQLSEICPANFEKRIFRYNPGSSIELVEENSVSLAWFGIKAPIQMFRSNLESFCVSTDEELAIIEKLIILEPGTVVIKPVFLSDVEDAQFLVISSNEIPLNATYVTVCGETRNEIFYSKSIENNH